MKRSKRKTFSRTCKPSIRWFECSGIEPAEFTPIGVWACLSGDALALLWMSVPETWTSIRANTLCGYTVHPGAYANKFAVETILRMISG